MSTIVFLILLFIIIIIYIFILPMINECFNSTETFKYISNIDDNKNNFYDKLFNNQNLFNTVKTDKIPYNDTSYIYNINNNLSNDNKLDMQSCSINCCGKNQWTPLMDPNYNNITSELNNNMGDIWKNNISNEYIGSNFSCNNGNNGNGCVCLKKNLFNNLQNHGIN